MRQHAVRAGWLLLLAVFAVSALAKLSDLPAFSFQLEEFGVPGRFTWPLAAAILVAELSIGVGLISRRHRRGTAAAGAAVLLTFAAAMAWLLANGHEGATCDCFGALLPLRVDRLHAVADVGLALVALAVYACDRGELAPSS